MVVMQNNDIEQGEQDPQQLPGEGQQPGENVATTETAAEPAALDSGQQPDTGDGLQQQLSVLEKQAQENLDQALRAQAELENVRKRSVRDVENAHRYALEKFANDVLPVLDSMELGVNAVEDVESNQVLREGMELTLKMFRDVLEKYGITEVETGGEKFDPERHEAVSMQEQDGAESGTIVSVFQKGYLLNGRLLRPAMVVVAK